MFSFQTSRPAVHGANTASLRACRSASEQAPPKGSWPSLNSGRNPLTLGYLGDLGNNALARIVATPRSGWLLPERRYGERQGCVGGPGTNRATTAVELVETSNKSECTRESEMPGACLAFFHTVGAGGETDSTMRKCVPQPSAIAPVRCHVSYCAWPAEARFDGRAKA